MLLNALFGAVKDTHDNLQCYADEHRDFDAHDSEHGGVGHGEHGCVLSFAACRVMLRTASDFSDKSVLPR